MYMVLAPFYVIHFLSIFLCFYIVNNINNNNKGQRIVHIDEWQIKLTYEQDYPPTADQLTS